MDPFVIIKRVGNVLKGLVMLQVDDSLILGGDELISENRSQHESSNQKKRNSYQIQNLTSMV